MIGVVLAVPLSRGLGKKSTYIFTMAALAVLSILFFYLPCTPFGFWLMLIMQIIISICTGIVSPLIWSMYADVSDYAELKDGTASTGLIFSSSSMAQKFGGAFGGAAVMWILGVIRLQYGGRCRADSGSIDGTEPANELDTCRCGCGGNDSRVLLSVDKEACGGN